MGFFRDVCTESKEEMCRFLAEHFRYNTMNHWNRSTSYACNMKIYNLDVPQETKDKLYDMLGCEEVYDAVNALIGEFDRSNGYAWQARFNGRSGGYLVLYQGGVKQLGYKSYCTHCGQGNFASVKKTGNVCGKCGRPERVDHTVPTFEPFLTPGKSIDMDEDFEEWCMDELRERVKLVQKFDALADNIVAEVRNMAENCSVKEEVYHVPVTRKVLVSNT